MKKIVVALLVLVFVMSFAACGEKATSSPETSEAQEKSETGTFVYVARDTANAYEAAQSSGFVEAIEDMGYTGIIRNAESSAAEDQIVIVEDLIAQNVDGICICCNDAAALEPVLQEAMEAGIITTSTDGVASEDSVYVHIAQCDAQSVGVYMAESVERLCDGEGQYAILSASSTSPEQLTWIRFMDEEMEDAKYANLERVTTVYGDDESEKSYTEAEGLIKSYPDVECIICPTTVGIMATAKAVTDKGLIGEIAVCGLGLPSEMAEYIKNGACPEFGLWSPIDNGYLAGCATVALAKGDLKAEVGSTFSAGRLGDGFEVVMLDDRLQVVLGPPMTFDASNIDEWKDIF